MKYNRILSLLTLFCFIAMIIPPCFASADDTLPSAEDEAALFTEEMEERIEETSEDESEADLADVSETALQYRLVGIEDGDEVILNEALGKTVSVIAENDNTFTVRNGKPEHNGYVDGKVSCSFPEASAGDAAKVMYYLDGELFAEDAEYPFVQSLDIEQYGEHIITAEIYDASGALVETIEKSFTAVYGEVAAEWSEDFEGENPIAPKNMVNTPVSGKTLTYNTIWKSEIKDYEGSNALYVNSGNGVKYDGTSAYVSIGLLEDGIDFTNNMNRVFVEFDYIPGYYGALLSQLAISECYKYGNGAGDYATVKIPSDIMRSSKKGEYKTTRLGIDVSWDNTPGNITVTYRVYVNGLEFYRNTTHTAHRSGGVNPAKFNAILMNSNALEWDWYIDNIRTVAYNAVDMSEIVLGTPEITLFDDNGNAMSGISDVSCNVNYMTVEIPGGTDPSTLEGNITLTDALTGEECALDFENEKIILKNQLKPGSTYELKVGTGAKNIDGLHCLGDKLFDVETSTGNFCIDRSQTGFSESELPGVGEEANLTFNAALLGEGAAGASVTVVEAVYVGGKMTALTVSEQTADVNGDLEPVTIVIDEVRENTVVEAFVTDNIKALTPVGYEVYSLR